MPDPELVSSDTSFNYRDGQPGPELGSSTTAVERAFIAESLDRLTQAEQEEEVPEITYQSDGM